MQKWCETTPKECSCGGKGCKLNIDKNEVQKKKGKKR